ncbi:sensor histidine kinase [Paenibacillus sambharensis]|uniref:histidine kinase n=1 Tax=Paenibacillus sambharensis TaxID=1803190 RepID=A0A2W1LGZ7_9BACL|nr:ATP-binding protein [Paenibacillus sambharensis]PZD93734.1 sensor histidine kinase [Paenibacillus sambharensis]
MRFLRSVVGKLWATIMALVAVVLIILGMFLLQYIDIAFTNADDVKMLFIITCIIGFTLSTFFAFFLSFKITQPLLQLKKAADLIAQGEYRTRVPIRSTDELGELAGTFNHMAAEVDKLIGDLQHEKDHLSSILRSMADAVITFDATGEVIMTNPEGEQIMEQWSSISRDQEPGQLQRYGSVPAPLYGLFRDVLRQGRDQTDKMHVQNDVWSIVMAPLKSKESVRGAVAVLRNVTEEYRLEKLRKDFVANVSHEIRTPLSMLQGYSEALLDDIAASPEERNELVQVIHDESLRMGRLVKDLLDLARMEAGHMEMKLEQADLSELIKRVHRKFLVYAKDRGIALRYDLPGEPIRLEQADEDRLEQVLTNLLDNAIRHTPEGKEIKISAEETAVKDKPFARVTVRDKGQGIPKEDIPFIFERFYKADKARTRGNSGGTGLGLAIVKNIIEAHAGTIEVASTLGEGTAFTLMLPVEGPGVLSKPRET